MTYSYFRLKNIYLKSNKHFNFIMKKFSVLILAVSLSLFSCSSDDGGSTINTPDIPAFAMSAKINGTIFQANNPFGTNLVSSTNIWNYYPIEDYIMLQAREGIVGNKEIKIWLKKTDMVVGTYQIGSETFDTPPSHFIDLLDNSNQFDEDTKEGVIVITEVNTTTKVVKGTFSFKTVDDLNTPDTALEYDVTEGNFRYIYEVE